MEQNLSKNASSDVLPCEYIPTVHRMLSFRFIFTISVKKLAPFYYFLSPELEENLRATVVWLGGVVVDW